MEIIAPAARDTERFVTVNSKGIERLVFKKGVMTPQDITVVYNQDVTKLPVTEVNLQLKMLVALK